MSRIWLVRHARSTANASGVLAGRMPGVQLDEMGLSQLADLKMAIENEKVDYVVSSPLERAQQTARAFVGDANSSIKTDERLNECDYGSWSGLELKTLADEPLWNEIQNNPASVTFPQGESMIAMQSRAISSVEFWKSQTDSLGILVSHGDVIKSVVAHYSRLELNAFQGIDIPPASITEIHFTDSTCTIKPVKYTSKRNRRKAEDLGGGDIVKSDS